MSGGGHSPRRERFQCRVREETSDEADQRAQVRSREANTRCSVCVVGRELVVTVVVDENVEVEGKERAMIWTQTLPSDLAEHGNRDQIPQIMIIPFIFRRMPILEFCGSLAFSTRCEAASAQHSHRRRYCTGTATQL